MKTKASYNLKLREYFINISSSQLLDFRNLKHFQQVILSSYLIQWLFFGGNSDLPSWLKLTRWEMKKGIHILTISHQRSNATSKFKKALSAKRAVTRRLELKWA